MTSDQEFKYQEQIKLMRKLATAQGFYEYYFSQLPKHKTNKDCFNFINDQYYEFFGEYKYSSYKNFMYSNTVRKK